MASTWRTEEEDLQTYNDNLPVWLPSEIRKEISLFATDGIRIGKYLDIQDERKMWAISQVLGVSGNMIQVHFCGWPAKWNTWVNYKEHGHLIAPLFSQATPRIDAREVPFREVTEHDYLTCNLLREEFPSMGFTKKYILDVLTRYSYDSNKQIAVNAVVYKALGGPMENLPKQLAKVLQR
eukprot:TRINITY_DN21001_c0_g1_i1.p1 TRINITY_DN21001_c0_g1~~TRINITY_DN21001_c0_g1_i1.p1  ORF type:complete len:180 (+),score=19.66 TRINITY_DN21001_c0_g1_i1:535-1074(+)